MFKKVDQLDEYYILLIGDFIECINKSKETYLTKYPDKSGIIFEIFKMSEFVRSTEMIIAKNSLIEELHCSQTEIDTLVNAALLLPRDSNTYWFTVPRAGIVFLACGKANKKIINLLKKRNFHQMLYYELLDKNVKSSFPTEFHLRSMIGNNFLEKKNSTSGPIIRIHPYSNF